MSWLARGVLALCAAAAVLALPAAANADDQATIVASCNGAACSAGWYTTNVTVAFSVSGSNIQSIDCPQTTISTDTTGQNVSCTVTFSDDTFTGKIVPIKRDATPPTVTAITPGRGPDSNGWYNHPVSFSVAGSDATSGIASCGAASYSGPDSGTASVTATCTDVAGNSGSKTLTLQYDASPPSVSAQAARGPDANGWYNAPVGVSFSGSSISGIASCTAPTTYSGPDSGSASVSGGCTDKAGNTGSTSLTIKYDSTPPTVSAHADRSADSNGWYDHPVGVTFTGSDSLSGIASCSSPTYSGPDSDSASVSGSCTDKAGNTASAAYSLKYDSTPPTLTALTAEPLDGGAALTWKQSKDAVAVTVARAEGAKAAATVYSGKPRSSWKDVKLRNGVTYTYTVTAVDGFGYAVARRATVRPSAPLLAPPPAGQVHGATTLRWRAARKAGYYNVQLWRRGAKVLTAWPTGPHFRLERTWKYLGRSQRLRPGRYVWYVWPGYGQRAKARFGRLIGKSTFFVVP